MVRRGDEGCSATQKLDFLRNRHCDNDYKIPFYSPPACPPAAVVQENHRIITAGSPAGELVFGAFSASSDKGRRWFYIHGSHKRLAKWTKL